VYHSDTPKPSKLLPRPCPICGNEYGSAQRVIFNDRFHKTDYYHYNRELRVITRIRHPQTRPRYRPTLDHPYKGTKWCNFMTQTRNLDDFSRILNRHSMRSITLPFSEQNYDTVKQYGWCVKESYRKHMEKVRAGCYYSDDHHF